MFLTINTMSTTCLQGIHDKYPIMKEVNRLTRTEASPMEPNHNGKSGCSCIGRFIYIQIQAILGHSRRKIIPIINQGGQF